MGLSWHGRQERQSMNDRAEHRNKSLKEKVNKPTKAAKPSKTPESIEDMLLTAIPDFGPHQYSSTTSALKQMMQEEIDRQKFAARQQVYMNQQLNQSGGGMASLNLSASYNNAFNSIYGPSPSPRPPRPMEPPKFESGDKVTIRTGKTVWTVDHYEEPSDPYDGRGKVRLYYLTNEANRQTREREEDLFVAESAQPKKAIVDFDTVVISDSKRRQILQALEQINQADLIFNQWGFGETIEKGKGVSMLFYGPPGTGKTLMGQAIANKLGKTLKVISTADIESSAPGEAERNIRKHFKEAKDGKSILLFDECDSLIFNRAGVGPILSAQINELLSQIERFDGVTLFTTNRLGTLDEAVNRRLALKLEFDMPSQEERAEIWKRMFPVQAPIANDVDFHRLAVVEITGGYIKNAVLRAARMAAIEKLEDKDKMIKMEHLVEALKLETASMVEFEEAREEHLNGYGHVSHSGRGQGIVRSNGKIEKVEA